MQLVSISLALICSLMLLNNNVHAAPVTNEVANTTPSPIIQLTSEQLAAFEANTNHSNEVVPEGEKEKALKSKKEKAAKDDDDDDLTNGPDMDDEDTTGTAGKNDDIVQDDEPAADNDVDDEPTVKNQVA